VFKQINDVVDDDDVTVQPDAVTGLSVFESSLTVNSATLIWTSPDDSKDILFRVSVRSDADNSIHVSSAVF